MQRNAQNLKQKKRKIDAHTDISIQDLTQTRKLCYRKDDRAMRAIVSRCGDIRPVAEIWPFEIFPRWRRPPSWICSNRK